VNLDALCSQPEISKIFISRYKISKSFGEDKEIFTAGVLVKCEK
jgi:hypothetical protein